MHRVLRPGARLMPSLAQRPGPNLKPSTWSSGSMVLGVAMGRAEHPSSASASQFSADPPMAPRFRSSLSRWRSPRQSELRIIWQSGPASVWDFSWLWSSPRPGARPIPRRFARFDSSAIRRSFAINSMAILGSKIEVSSRFRNLARRFGLASALFLVAWALRSSPALPWWSGSGGARIASRMRPQILRSAPGCPASRRWRAMLPTGVGRVGRA